MRFLRILLLLLIALLITYMVGPRPDRIDMDLTLTPVDAPLSSLDELIEGMEDKVEGLKPDNHSRIIWADSLPMKTPYSIVYLHGYSASPMEGSPVHLEVAKRLKANLYLHRLVDHGIDIEDAFLELTPEKMMASALDALAIGQAIGDSVIVMSCSTGGTLSLYMAAHVGGIHSLIMYSPNVDFAKPGSDMLTKPWGLQLARMMFKGKHRSLADWPAMAPYWTMKYRLEGLVNLKSMVEHTMVDETFEAVDIPVFLGYYYKSEEEQDAIVKVDAMLRMYGLLKTPTDKKRKRAFPDAGGHVINSEILSSDVDGVIEETVGFLEDVLLIKM